MKEYLQRTQTELRDEIGKQVHRLLSERVRRPGNDSETGMRTKLEEPASPGPMETDVADPAPPTPTEGNVAKAATPVSIEAKASEATPAETTLEAEAPKVGDAPPNAPMETMVGEAGLSTPLEAKA